MVVWRGFPPSEQVVILKNACHSSLGCRRDIFMIHLELVNESIYKPEIDAIFRCCYAILLGAFTPN